VSQFGWVSVFRKIAFALCALKAATQCDFRWPSPRSHLFPRGGVSARQRALNQEASWRNSAIFRHRSPAEKYLFNDIARFLRRQRFAKPADRPVHVSIESLSK
jgi:hypothetical protein